MVLAAAPPRRRPGGGGGGGGRRRGRRGSLERGAPLWPKHDKPLRKNENGGWWCPKCERMWKTELEKTKDKYLK